MFKRIVVIIIFVFLTACSTTEIQSSKEAEPIIPTQEDYDNIKKALEQYEEARSADEEKRQTYDGLRFKYSQVLETLEKVKVIPDEYIDEVKDIKIFATEKTQHYSDLDRKNKEEYNKQKLLEKADQRTLDPQPVTIGMTQEEVLTKGWGRPNKINTTTTKNTIYEQWVFSGYRYLYFENGELVSIQD